MLHAIVMPSRISCENCLREKMIGGSYRQAVFTGLKNVSDRCAQPCGKAFWHFYSGVNFEVINNFYGPVGPRGRCTVGGREERVIKTKQVVRAYPLSCTP